MMSMEANFGVVATMLAGVIIALTYGAAPRLSAAFVANRSDATLPTWVFRSGLSSRYFGEPFWRPIGVDDLHLCAKFWATLPAAITFRAGSNYFRPLFFATPLNGPQAPSVFGWLVMTGTILGWKVAMMSLGNNGLTTAASAKH